MLANILIKIVNIKAYSKVSLELYFGLITNIEDDLLLEVFLEVLFNFLTFANFETCPAAFGAGLTEDDFLVCIKLLFTECLRIIV